jgi:prepilin-type N-terminal cleavage/methylation domain-containing protein
MKRQGFTLIELLIVLTLIGLSLSVVAPLGMAQLEKSRAFDEVMQLEQFCQRSADKAYLSGQVLFVRAAQNQLTLARADATEIARLSFSYLTFPEQNFTINQHGFVDVMELHYLNRGMERQLPFPTALRQRAGHAD